MKKTLIALMVSGLAGFAAFGQDTAKEDSRNRAKKSKRRQGDRKGHQRGREGYRESLRRRWQSHGKATKTARQGGSKRDKEGCP